MVESYLYRAGVPMLGTNVYTFFIVVLLALMRIKHGDVQSFYDCADKRAR